MIYEELSKILGRHSSEKNFESNFLELDSMGKVSMKVVLRILIILIKIVGQNEKALIQPPQNTV